MHCYRVGRYSTEHAAFQGVALDLVFGAFGFSASSALHVERAGHRAVMKNWFLRARKASFDEESLFQPRVYG